MTRTHFKKLFTCALLPAALSLCASSIALAQEPAPATPAPTPAAEPAAPPAADATATDQPAPPPAAAGDIAAEVAALRAEVAELKTKQEEAEAAALLNEGAAPVTEATSGDEALRVYGFMDFGLDKFFTGADSGVAVVRPTRANTFVFGNLNLYFDATPVENLRCLAEVRLTLAPHGEETQLAPPIGMEYVRQNTTTFDFSSPSSQAQLRLGGLFIERAWSEYEFSKAFKMQWGLFLNPFGIWNLDHGSPTLISLMLPTFISAQMVPTRLLGLHAYGSQFIGNSEIGYALHVTNGRGPIDFDFSEDKAVGGRLYWANEGDFGRFVLGASGYWGTYLDQQRGLTFAGGQASVGELKTVEYTEQVLGIDAALDVGGLRVRGEAVFHWVNYEPGRVETAISTDGGPALYLPNRVEFSGYLLAAYRTPWRIEPYVEVESMINKSAILPRWAPGGYSSPNVAVLYLSAGINVELTTHTQLKTQLVWDQAWARNFTNKNTDVPILFVRLVDSF